MTLKQLESSHIKGNLPFEFIHIMFHSGVPVLVEGTIQDKGKAVDVYWNARSGLAYIGQDEAEQYNLLPTN